MKYDWYETIRKTSEITQGDIIRGCLVPIPCNSVYDSIDLFNSSENGVIEVDEPFDVKEFDLIILSQACDLENDKIDSVVLCPIWPLKRLISDNFKSSDRLKGLRQGKEPAFHLLREHQSEDMKMEFAVVDFHQIYTLPKEFLKKHAAKFESRLRLLPPYREHLSQAFARYFMRVGLPVDISWQEIKDYKDGII